MEAGGEGEMQVNKDSVHHKRPTLTSRLCAWLTAGGSWRGPFASCHRHPLKVTPAVSDEYLFRL